MKQALDIFHRSKCFGSLGRLMDNDDCYSILYKRRRHRAIHFDRSRNPSDHESLPKSIPNLPVTLCLHRTLPFGKFLEDYGWFNWKLTPTTATITLHITYTMMRHSPLGDPEVDATVAARTRQAQLSARRRSQASTNS